MDLFLKIIGVLIGFGFLFFGFQFFFRGRKIIAWVQKHKYDRTAEPRSVEVTMTKIIGVILTAIGIYYSGIAILSFFWS